MVGSINLFERNDAMFESEETLTQVFDIALSKKHSPFTPRYVAREFDYREGRTDVIAFDRNGNLLAFEMKLDKWKQALHQAYRNSSFAHYSYVVVPLQTALRAAMQEHEFLRRGVGLCSVDGTRIRIEIHAIRVEPLRPWLTESAIEYMVGAESCKTMHALKI